MKFTPKGEIALTAKYDSSKLTIAISDTGKGMATEDRERIFQEFTRLSGAQGEEGFGLGLSIVKKLVVLLEGTIDVQSKLGRKLLHSHSPSLSGGKICVRKGIGRKNNFGRRPCHASTDESDTCTVD